VATVSAPSPDAVAVSCVDAAVAVPLDDDEVAPWESVDPAGAGGGLGTTVNAAEPVDPP